jgi:CRISPR-associated endonuclease/helicase Cas3
MLAHSKNEFNQDHPLKDHLTSTGRLARSLAGFIGAPELAYRAGLLHDVGKYHPDFQNYLKGLLPHGPNHSAAGAILATRITDLLSFVIAGHHSGLPSPAELKARLSQPSENKLMQEALPLMSEDLGLLADWPKTGVIDLLPPFLMGQATDIRLRTELFIRLLYSTLVDADFLDTEAHFAVRKSELRGTELSITDLWNRFAYDQSQLSGRSEGPVNKARHEIYQFCLDAARWDPGIFSLTVPTGGGKTRSAMGFALRHALCHNLRRVIVAIPYTSIIEQTADVYRAIFGPDAVIEHHSSVPVDDETGDSESELKARLAAENWDAPIIVTTTVQLFESLFSNRASRCRKLHNIASSVLILDEVQTLPLGLLDPILEVLQQLVDFYRVSVVLCTATQPSVEEGPLRKGLRNVREIVQEPQRYFTSLQRVEYEFPSREETWTWNQVAAAMEDERQVLTIVNTKKDALNLLDALGEQEGLYHLSTLMCGAHRRDVLRIIRERLSNNEPCRVVSTQVVEAGVDLDFPTVFRAIGPLDRIIQAAGRCNREGKRQKGRVVVFAPDTGGLPRGSYRSGTDTFLTMLHNGIPDLSKLDVITTYFRSLYGAVNLDRQEINKLRQQLNFPEVSRRFRLIPDDTEQVVVRYGDSGKVLDYIAMIRSKGPSRHMLRLLQPYMVGVSRYNIQRFQNEGSIAPIIPGLWQWLGGYDKLRGLATSFYDPSDLIG